jgi:hypothetical protein
MADTIADKYSEILEVAYHAQGTHGDMLKMIPMLPDSDNELNELVAWASKQRDVPTFLSLTMAAAWDERPVDIDLVLGAENLFSNANLGCAAAVRASGDVIGKVVEYSEKLRLTPLAATVFLFAAAWLAKEKHPERLEEVIEAAAVVPRRLTPKDSATFKPLAALADYLGDPRVDPDFGRVKITKGSEKALQGEIETWKEWLLQSITEHPSKWLPEDETGYAPPKGTKRRAVPKIGRNERCHCGSGKKYKRCCLGTDQDRLRDSSNVAGRTNRELTDEAMEYVTVEMVSQLNNALLFRLEPDKVAPEALPYLAVRMNYLRDPLATAQFYEKFGVTSELEPHWRLAISYAADHEEVEAVKRLAALVDKEQLKSPEVSVRVRFLLDDVERGEALELVEEAIRHGLDDEGALLNVAYSMHRWGCYGLAAALSRALVTVRPKTELLTLLKNLIAEARIKADLEPTDASFYLCDRLLEEGDEETVAVELAEHKERLEDKSKQNQRLLARIHELKTDLKKQEKRIEASQKTDPAEEEKHGETEELRALRRKTNAIKQQLKERHDERNALARELETAQKVLNEHQSRLTETAAEEDGDAYDEGAEDRLLEPAEEPGVEPPRTPTIHPRFVKSVGALPTAIQRAAYREIGYLCAGDQSAFATVRRIIERPEYHRQRVKTTHRLAFKKLGDSLEVVDIFDRKLLVRKIPNLP